MPGQRRFGMDHEHYDWSPIIKRGVLRWPENARVALCVIVNLEQMEWNPSQGSYQSATLAGGLGPRSFPDYTRFSHREYGHRVGIFRVLDVLETQGIKATVAMDALTAENYPYLVRHCLSRGCEIIGHGMSVSRMITSHMSEQEEQEYIQASIEAVRRATGSAPAGWFGPEYGESSRTPQLLAQAGIRYVCDWANDEQPYRMKTSQGEIFTLPIMLELDDLNALWDRHIPIDRYREMLKEGFDTLYRDGAQNGRLLVLNLHPWLIGQPFRIGYLDDALGAMMRRQGVWTGTGSEIVDWYRKNPPLR
ncbi:MAG: polysaccharide deacetylase family protein [Candidatus Tectomicrobia bacterium]|nr:polysaccharide deacetylase family protein [Candidatus Tectomicrobia bacterium]